jgi:hypothetical protein
LVGRSEYWKSSTTAERDEAIVESECAQRTSREDEEWWIALVFITRRSARGSRG